MPALGTAGAWQALLLARRRFSRWRVKTMARTAANFKLRLALLVGFSFLNVAIGALLYRMSSPDEDWLSSLFTVYAVLWSIPGADITNNPSLLATVVLNLIFVFGLLVFATILAMISDEINSLLMAARSGKAPLALSGHVLLLNYNKQVPFVLDQLEQVQLQPDHPFAGRPLVILADKDKEELDSQVLGFLKQNKLEVHVRSGKPYKLEHLVRVSAADAAAVLLMHPELGEGGGGGGGDDGGDDASVSADGGGGDGGDAQEGAAALKMQTIMALTSLLAGRKVAMVVQAPDDNNLQLQELDDVLVRAGHPSNLMNLPVKRMVSSLAVQTAIQPWSASIYQRIMQHSLTPNLTFVEVPQTLFALKARRAAVAGAGIGSPTARAASASASAGAGGGGALAVLGEAGALADVTVSFEEARGALAAAGGQLLALGFVASKTGQLHLNPSDRSRLEPGDELVVLTSKASCNATDIKLPLAERLQSGLLKAALALYSQPLVASLLSKLPRRKPAARAALAARRGDSAAEGMDAAAGQAAESSSAAAAAAATASGSSSRLDTVAEAGDAEETAAPAAAVSAAAEPAAAAEAAADGGVSREVQPVPAAAAAHEQQPLGSEPAANAGAAAAATATAAAAGAATAAGTPQLDAVAPAAAKQVDAPVPPADAAAADDSTPAAAGAAAVAAPASASAPEAAGATAAAADDGASTARGVAVAGPAAAAGAAAAAGGGKATAKKKRSAFSCFSCFSAPAVKEDGEEPEPAATAAGSKQLGAKGKSASFKLDKLGKTVMTGAMTGVTGGAALVGKAVTTVGAGAASVGKTVVTGAVNTVADGATLVGKTVVSTAALATDAVKTVADGAAGVSKTVMSGAVSTVTGGAALVGKTVTKAGRTIVAAPSMLSRADSMTSRGDSEPAALLAPATWLFGAGKKMTQNAAKAMAFGRLAKVDVAAARAPPTKRLRLVVAGFTAAECAADLVGRFLDFAPANSVVTFAVKEDEPPEGFEMQGTLEEEEEREDAEPIQHRLHYRFLTVPNPLSSAGLTAAGVLSADAVLLAADEALRGSPAEADAQVLASFVSIQSLLAARGPTVAPSTRSRSQTSGADASHSVAGSTAGAALRVAKSFGSGAASAVRSLSLSKAGEDEAAGATSWGGDEQEDEHEAWGAEQGPAGAAGRVRLPHIVACVATTSAKAVAAAFFGSPAAAAAAAAGAAGTAGSAATSGRALAAALAPGGAAAGDIADAGAAGGADDGGSGVVGPRWFTYELLVPGEIEGSLLVQAANESNYMKVVQEMLVTSEGCELYALPPASFGFAPGEELSFQEVAEVGRLLRRTVIGVVSGGSVSLAPDAAWRWRVQAGDRIAAIADSW